MQKTRKVIEFIIKYKHPHYENKIIIADDNLLKNTWVYYNEEVISLKKILRTKKSAEKWATL